MSHDGNLPGANPYIVETIIAGTSQSVRIGHEEIGTPDEVWLSAQQFLLLMDWGAEHRQEIEKMARERARFEEQEKERQRKRERLEQIRKEKENTE